MSGDRSTSDLSRPRILATQSDFERAERLVETDGTVQSWFAAVESTADELLETPPREHDIPDGRRLLGASRSVLKRVLTLGVAYRLTGRVSYAERLWRELDTAANFPDWNPSHFLDTAEMTAAFAVGYDWLYAYWDSQEAERLADAMLEHGLRVALPGYRGEANHDYLSWMDSDKNWNTVCNAGLTLGALSLLDESNRYEAVTDTVIDGSRSSIQRSVASVGPHGGWEEGVGYWAYNAKYLVFYLASLEHTFGTTFGLAGRPGIASLGDFPLHMTAPTSRPFRFGDGGTRRPTEAALFWIATRFERPAYARYQLESLADRSPEEYGRSFPINLLWYDPNVVTASKVEPPQRDRYFPGGDQSVVARAAWGDPDAAFVGFKAGNNQSGHGDLDIGTFVFDAKGVRWACDVGANTYSRAEPAYWESGPDGRRWQFYRKRAEGHNTLVIGPDDGPDQDPLANCSIESVHGNDDGMLAISTITDAYAHADARRGVGLVENRSELLVRDEFDARGQDVWWFMHTGATVDVHDKTATLRRDDQHMQAAIVSPEAARFEVMDAKPLPTTAVLQAEEPVEDVRKLAIRVPAAETTAIEVHVGPEVTPDARPRPLWTWPV